MLIIKVGGGKNINLDDVLDDFAQLPEPKILIHGGNSELDATSKQLGHPPRIITSQNGQKSRFTDERTMDIFMMIYAGKRNKRIVEGLHQRGVNAFGCSGIDGGLVRGKRRERIRCVENGKSVVLHGDYTGSIESVNTTLLTTLIDAGCVPVLTSPILSESGEALNVDHDKLAMQIAVALKAEKLVFLFEAPGLLRDANDETSCLQKVSLSEIEETLTYAQGRMKKKIIATKWMLEQGIQSVYYADGRVKNPIQRALKGQGTVLTRA